MDNTWHIIVEFDEGEGAIEHRRTFKGNINGVLRTLKEITKWGEVRKMIVEKGGEESDEKKKG